MRHDTQTNENVECFARDVRMYVRSEVWEGERGEGGFWVVWVTRGCHAARPATQRFIFSSAPNPFVVSGAIRFLHSTHFLFSIRFCT